jgi:SAM-dependent methyltransferase
VEGRRSSPAVARNTGPILQVLAEVLPDSGTVVEIASGSGEHVLAFARAYPHLLWQPTDADPVALRSIEAWRTDAPPNLLAPVPLDAASAVWPIESADTLVCINMVHISPWGATMGLLDGAARLLGPGAPLYLYGPYRQAGVPTAPSNEAFDHSLKSRDPEWGLRDLEEVIAQAEARDFGLDRVVPMPANNLSVVLRRS